MSSLRLIMALWVIQPAIQAVIAIIFYRRKLHKEFPAFFSYTLAQVSIFCIQLPIYLYAGSTYYFLAYWSAAALNLVFTFRIIHEIFLDVFKPYHALKDLATALFKWAAIITILVSVVLIAVSPNWEDPLATSILVVQRCVSVVQCGLVVFLLAFCRNLGVSWRRLSFGIALGFGITSVGELLTFAMYSGGRMHTQFVQIGVLAADNVGILVWALYSIINRRRDLVPVLVPQRWDEVLADIQAAPSDANSLIPMFEHIVDQALSKTDRAHA